MKLYILLFAVFSSSAAFAEINNYEASGNLESPNPTECVPASKLINSQNPVDIFNGVSQCIKSNNYKFASELYLAAMVYGVYDTMRVADKTAHQGIMVLRMNAFGGLSKGNIDELQKSINSILKNNKNYCSTLEKLGLPAYHPKYMIQHGMGAFKGATSNNGILEDFDAGTAWKKSLASVTKCIAS